MKWSFSLLLIFFLPPLDSKFTSGFDKHLNQIVSPINVPCNISLCTGPLAEIYCHGPILSNAWQFGLEKTCPGDKLRVPANEVLKNFGKLQYPLQKEDFEKFCKENFEQKNYLEAVDLNDWSGEPKFLEQISSEKFRKLAKELHQRWNRLAREFTSDVMKNSELYPLLPISHPFIVPGGRFDVYFYWDTYWIVKGLLVSEMVDTTRGIIDNFAGLVEKLGYIPNSGNLQLTRRSQPPLFPHMVWEFSKKTNSYEKKWLEMMKREMEFWETNRTVLVDGNTMFVYKTSSNCPRPENFLSDYNLGMHTSNPSGVWRSISSACESGWDFSSRWMHDNSTNDLATIHTDQIVPVDLNVIMAMNYRIIASYSEHFGDFEHSARYLEKVQKLINSIQKVLWDESKGAWFDFDILENKRNLNFYPSNVYPLMIPDFHTYSERVEKYLKNSGALNFAGGIPSGLPAKSTQQWDFPNVWAPNQHFVIQSFLVSKNPVLAEHALTQAQRFIESVYNGLYHPEPTLEAGIWEKYDARSTAGAPGAGGEYIVQEGFGWTNGAVLDLIWTFRATLKADKSQEIRENTTGGKIPVLIYAAIGFCALTGLLMLIKGYWRRKSRTELENDMEAGESLLANENPDDEENDL